ESYCGSILATAALGAAAGGAIGLSGKNALPFVIAPMALAGIGIALSVASIYFVKTEEGASQRNLLWALRRGVWGASGLIVLASLLITWMVLGGVESQSTGVTFSWLGIFGSIVTGLVAGVLIGWFTEYYTSTEYGPTKWISTQCKTGPATTIIGGIAQGMLSSWASLLIVAVGTMLAYSLAGGFQSAALGLYGVGIAAVGMLATLGITLATDAYGPIADNAGGNAQMTHQPAHIRERTDALDSLGNTTAATGKGFAIGSAALTALALLAAFVEEVRIGIEREATTYIQSQPGLALESIVAVGSNKFAQKLDKPEKETGFFPAYISVTGGEKTVPYVVENGVARKATNEEIVAYYVPDILKTANVIHLKRVKDASLEDFMGFYKVTLMNPKVLVGAFLGVLMVFVFCGLTMKAVGRAAGRMVEEVRRQFRELNLLSDPKAKADYATCVSIATAGAQREMIFPSLLAVAAPVVIGLLLDVSGVMGLLAGGLTCGFAVAVFMANSGGAWDNAKKFIEAGNYGGKGSDAHKAGVVGDTVGDPFKDTSGPALNILIKLMSMVAVVFAGMIVKYGPQFGEMLGMK
ncbi:MAG: sodium/proton-translocating pyrophosphatase, partial [Planctomycetia bacterium]|nr:sodium/proton-translocating pyrophosphatase [Planctomycetia bacterium]